VGRAWTRPTRGDVALVVVLAALEIAGFGQDPGTSVASHAVALLLPLALLARRAAPALAPVAFLLATVLTAALHLHAVDSAAAVFAVVIGTYSAAAYLPLRPAVATLPVWCLGFLVQLLQDRGEVAELVFPAVLLVCSFTPGLIVRGQRGQAEDARLELERSAAREAERAAQAVAEERARIARELHDVVAHAVSIMVVQASAAQEVVERDPARARSAMQTVQRVGRSAVEELSRMLELLRGEDDALAPLPTLERLPLLVEEVRSSGVDVVLSQDVAGPLPPAVELCVYRVVQEATTNAVKHARDPRVRVLVRCVPDGVEVVVEDDGGSGPRASAGTGSGLVGLRERVSLFGGRLESGPRPGGGFRVRAVVPVAGRP
jgi:signal transduction histidine kinase